MLQNNSLIQTVLVFLAIVVITTNTHGFCSDNVLDVGEECDGMADAACPGNCLPTCFCIPSTCSITNLNPDSILEGESADVELSYVDFSFPPAIGSVDCYGGAFPGALNCAAGSCTVSCGPYGSEGLYPVAVSLQDGSEIVYCGSSDLAVSAPPPSGPDFQVVSFEITPSTVIVTDVLVETVVAFVEVRNLRSGAENAVVELDVVKSDGSQMVLPLPSASKPVDSTIVEFSGGAPDNMLFDVDSSWEPGNYAVHARVYDTVAPRKLHASSVQYLTVGYENDEQRVPELGLVLLPLIAFSVLAVLFYRKN